MACLVEGFKDAAECCSLNYKPALAVITEAAGRNEQRDMHRIQYLITSWRLLKEQSVCFGIKGNGVEKVK